MATKFWEAVGSKLADRWLAASAPAVIFWFGGLLAWLYARGGFAPLEQPLEWLGQQSAPAQIGILLALLLAVVASGELVNELTTPTLRLMEGYWPARFDIVS